MYKLFTRCLICFCIVVSIWSCTLIRDKKVLQDNLIRFHVVANSDTESDQAVKLKVRDAVINSIREDMLKISDAEEAKDYLLANLSKIQEIANRTLHLYGFEEKATVTLGKETFDTRFYDTFALPAGVYESLQIVIGEGKGRNWWCVTFPQLCIPVSCAEFEEQAVSAGFSKAISNTLSGKPKYKLRFFILDALGKVESKICLSK